MLAYSKWLFKLAICLRSAWEVLGKCLGRAGVVAKMLSRVIPSDVSKHTKETI